MMLWANLIGYQVVWFLLVRGAAHGQPWLPMLAGAAFVVWQVVSASNAAVECRLLILAVLLGVAVDGTLAFTGWLSYASPSPALPFHGAPLWILMLWACFATTINRSLKALHTRPLLAAVVGAVGAPMAYLAAARGWDAVRFAPSPYLALAWLAAGWACALTLLSHCALRWNNRYSARPA